MLLNSEAESLLLIDPPQSMKQELFTLDGNQSKPNTSSTTSTSTIHSQSQSQSSSSSQPHPHNSAYTYTQRKKRTLEDAVLSIAESCKRQNTYDDMTSPMMGMLVQLMQSLQQQQQAQQQFFVDVLSKLLSNK